MAYTELIIGIVIGGVITFLLMLLKKNNLPVEIKAKLNSLETENKELVLQKSEIVPSPKVEIISIHSEDISKFSTQNHLENKGNLAEI